MSLLELWRGIGPLETAAADALILEAESLHVLGVEGVSPVEEEPGRAPGDVVSARFDYLVPFSSNHQRLGPTGGVEGMASDSTVV